MTTGDVCLSRNFCRERRLYSNRRWTLGCIVIRSHLRFTSIESTANPTACWIREAQVRVEMPNSVTSPQELEQTVDIVGEITVKNRLTIDFAHFNLLESVKITEKISTQVSNGRT